MTGSKKKMQLFLRFDQEGELLDFARFEVEVVRKRNTVADQKVRKAILGFPTPIRWSIFAYS